MLEVVALVSSSAGTVSGLANSSTPTREPTKGTLQSTTLSEIPTASHLESIRRHHTSIGVSEQPAELLVAGWNKGTNTAY